MIWHIFKKDVRLLWWLAAAVAALHVAETAILLQSGLFPQSPRLILVGQLLSLGELLGAGFAIVAVVHQDTIPGVRQDWLVRPIRRLDLLLAKLLFVILMVQLPMLLANFSEALLNGFPFGASLASATSRSVYLLLLIDIPFLAFASVTRNLLETIAGAVAIFAVVGALVIIFTGKQGSQDLQPTIRTGLAWITLSSMILVMIIGASMLVALQYFQRRTLLARSLTGVVACLSFFTVFMPWQPAFAIQRAISSSSQEGGSVAINFNPGLGRLKRDFTLRAPGNESGGNLVPVFLPLRISGLPEEDGIQVDRAEVSLIERDGHRDAVGCKACVQAGSLSALHERSGDSSQDTHQGIVVQGELFNRVKDQALRLEIEYTATLFRLASTNALPAVNGERRIPNVGWCATRLNNSETAVQISCEQAGRRPVCRMNLLETPSGVRNPARFNCEQADYSPYTAWLIVPDSLWRFGQNLPFRDQAGLAHYPVDGTKLHEAQVVMRVYEPADHFQLKLVIPEIRLSGWIPESPGI